MNIASFFDKLVNPLDDYEKIVKVNTKGKVMNSVNTKDEDYYFASVFNDWKNNLCNMDRDSFTNLVNANPAKKELLFIRKYLKEIPDVTTREEVDIILWRNCPPNLRGAINRNDPFTAPNVYPLIYTASAFIGNLKAVVTTAKGGAK